MNIKILWKCSLGDWSFLQNRGHYFKKNFNYLIYLDLHKIMVIRFSVVDLLWCIFFSLCWWSLTIWPPCRPNSQTTRQTVVNQSSCSVPLNWRYHKNGPVSGKQTWRIWINEPYESMITWQNCVRIHGICCTALVLRLFNVGLCVSRRCPNPVNGILVRFTCTKTHLLITTWHLTRFIGFDLTYWDWETETETETSLFNTTWHYTDAWY